MKKFEIKMVLNKMLEERKSLVRYNSIGELQGRIPDNIVRKISPLSNYRNVQFTPLNDIEEAEYIFIIPSDNPHQILCLNEKYANSLSTNYGHTSLAYANRPINLGANLEPEGRRAYFYNRSFYQGGTRDEEVASKRTTPLPFDNIYIRDVFMAGTFKIEKKNNLFEITSWTDSSGHFWPEYDQKTGFQIPPPLKNILHIDHFVPGPRRSGSRSS